MDKNEDGRLLDRLAANKGAYEMEVEYNKTKAMEKKPWVELTDDEIKEIVGSYAGPIKGYTRELFDKIDAKLKEKNGG